MLKAEMLKWAWGLSLESWVSSRVSAVAEVGAVADGGELAFFGVVPLLPY